MSTEINSASAWPAFFRPTREDEAASQSLWSELWLQMNGGGFCSVSTPYKSSSWHFESQEQLNTS